MRLFRGRRRRTLERAGLLPRPIDVPRPIHLTLARGIVLLAVSLIAAAPGAWAQQSLLLGTGSVLTLNGLTLTVTGCTVNNVACAASNNIELLGVPSGRGTVTVDVIGNGGGPIFSIANGTTGTVDDVLALSYSVATNAPSSAKITSAALSLNASTTGNWSTSSYTSWSQTDSRGPSPASLNLNSGSGGLATSSWSPSPSGSTFTVSDTITLQRTYGTNAGTVTLASAVQKFIATPEPASIAVVLMGLGGLVFARRRRLAQR